MLAETLVFWENMQAEEFILVKNGHVPKSQQPLMGPKLLPRNDYEIYKHVHSEAHCQVESMLKKQNEKRLETSMASVTSRLMTTTENCLRSAYFIAYNHRPMSDMQALVQMQTLNGADMGLTLKSKDSCIAMAECISADMRKKLCRIIIYKKRNISIVPDESTSLSQNTCLILYIRSKVDEFNSKPENIFLDLCELKEQNA